ncbi:MAG: MFS transporter [Tatlockia sp.]|nr:MFS transporter [Tatlockia sp.]
MSKYRNIVACIIGNVLEWYEFSLFAYLSPVIAKLFFPDQNAITSLLATMLVFAAGFVVRPLGSIILGHFGDRFGRAKTLKITILLMSISSVLTGCLPTYQQLGLIAPFLLIICRLLQGFCIGGEFAGSMIYLSESANTKHRALISSMTNNGSNIGVLTAIIACTIFTNFFGDEVLYSYGWRLLFISGGLLGIIGLWLRRDLSESDIFLQLQLNINEHYFPIKHVITRQYQRIFHIILLLFISACGSYTLMGFLSTYLHEFLKMPLNKSFEMQTFFIILSLMFVPIFAYLSDRFGRKIVLLFSVFGYLVFAMPSFWFLQENQNWWVLLPLMIFYSAEQAVTPVVLAEMFPGKGRYTGISMGYNISMAIVGGFSPLINTWLINRYNNLMIAYYVIFCALISLISILKYLPKEYGEEKCLSMA